MHKIGLSVYFLSFFILILFFIVMPQGGLSYDMECWRDWALHIHEHGLKNAYNSSINYLPGHLYEIKLFTLLFNTKDQIIWNIYYLKHFTFLFDIAGALLICSLTPDIKFQKIILLVLLLNPAFIHNTVAWGQFDSVFSCLILASFLSLFQKKFLLGAVLFLLSLNFKLQALIFFPALLLLAIHLSELKINWKYFFIGLLLLALIQTIILSPFIFSSSVHKVVATLKALGGEFNYLSLKAANFWHLVQKGDLRWTSDANKFLGITYKNWGLILFSVTLLITLLPIIKGIYQNFFQISSNIPVERMLIVLALSNILFFYFNTQMHERYSYPAFLFIAAYAVISQRWWLYVFFSLAYFLNNEKVLQSLKIINYNSSVYDFRFISLLFLGIITTLFLILFFDKKIILMRDSTYSFTKKFFRKT